MSSEKSIDIHPVSVLKSSHSLLIEEFVEGLKKKLSANSPKLLFESKNLDEVSLSEIVEDARTLPMFHERKLIVVKGYDDLGKDGLDLLNKYAASPASFSVLVLLSQGSRKNRVKPAKSIKLVDLDRGRTIPREIKRLAEKLGLALTPGAVGFIKTMLGEDMNLIRNELEKISLYGGGEKTIGEKDLRGLMEKTEYGERILTFNRAFKQGSARVSQNTQGT